MCIRDSEDTVTQIYAEKFADEVDRLSDGKMKISVYPNSVPVSYTHLLRNQWLPWYP